MAAAAGYVLGLLSRSGGEPADRPPAVEVLMPAPEAARWPGSNRVQVGGPEQVFPQLMPQAGSPHADCGMLSEPRETAPIPRSLERETCRNTDIRPETEKGAEPQPQVIRGGPTRPLKPRSRSGSM
jgi:hypothetical protein